MQGGLLSGHEAPGSNSFSLLRLAAAAAVVVSHNFGILTGDLKADPVDAWTGFTLGKHAVHVFFVFSGLLITMSLVRRASLFEYARARALRIAPGLLACVLLTTFVLGPLVTVLPLAAYLSHAETAAYLVKTLALVTGKAPLPGVFASAPIAGEVNLSLWTLKYEVLCYVLLALAAALGALRSGHLRTALLGIVLLIAGSYLWPEGIAADTPLDNARRFLFCFSLGALAYLAREHVRYHWTMCMAALLATAVLYGTRFGVPVLLLTTALLAIMLGMQRYGTVSALTDRYDLSYGVYVYGWPVGQTVLLLAPSIGLLAFQATTLGLSLLLGLASWVLVERPALQLKTWPAGWRVERRSAA
jgi:peptidoglycan/LPS O-acetylase OafA/YrhL